MWTSTGKRAKPERKPELTIPEGGKIGQVLVLTANGLEWQDRRMVAELDINGEDDKYYCDKTFNELYDAWNRGVDVEIHIDQGYSLLLKPLLIDNDKMVFANTFAESGGIVGCYAEVTPDNQWEVSETDFAIPTNPDSNTES